MYLLFLWRVLRHDSIFPGAEEIALYQVADNRAWLILQRLLRMDFLQHIEDHEQRPQFYARSGEGWFSAFYLCCDGDELLWNKNDLGTWICTLHLQVLRSWTPGLFCSR